MHGKVKWFNQERGYGFIIDEDGEDRFFHYTALTFTSPRVDENMRVEFDLEHGRRGLECRNIQLVNESEPAA